MIVLILVIRQYTIGKGDGFGVFHELIERRGRYIVCQLTREIHRMSTSYVNDMSKLETGREEGLQTFASLICDFEQSLLYFY